jgi:hypothetical protein
MAIPTTPTRTTARTRPAPASTAAVRSGAGLLLLTVGLANTAVAAVLVLTGPGALPVWCVGVAIALRLTANGQYVWATVRGRARPNAVTWLLWGLIPLIAAAAQIGESPRVAAVSVALAVGPLVIAAVAVARVRVPHVTCCSGVCAGAAAAGVVGHLPQDDPLLAIACCIAADAAASLPTLWKAWRDPASEYPAPYVLTVLSMLVTLLALDRLTLLAWAFPFWILTVNALVLVVSSRRPAGCR